jgi:hypothetical protein
LSRTHDAASTSFVFIRNIKEIDEIRKNILLKKSNNLNGEQVDFEVVKKFIDEDVEQLNQLKNDLKNDDRGTKNILEYEEPV